ncbi:hypothetical protein Fmac_008652 [Flemingia macrophylla]|uniref:Uncharacterized protein n=1 Tax=Flemingia macrophylla TaxID=520843 RepID=A0ABD1MYW7_9FABA
MGALHLSPSGNSYGLFYFDDHFCVLLFLRQKSEKLDAYGLIMCCICHHGVSAIPSSFFVSLWMLQQVEYYGLQDRDHVDIEVENENLGFLGSQSQEDINDGDNSIVGTIRKLCRGA